MMYGNARKILRVLKFQTKVQIKWRRVRSNKHDRQINNEFNSDLRSGILFTLA